MNKTIFLICTFSFLLLTFLHFSLFTEAKQIEKKLDFQLKKAKEIKKTSKEVLNNEEKIKNDFDKSHETLSKLHKEVKMIESKLYEEKEKKREISLSPNLIKIWKDDKNVIYREGSELDLTYVAICNNKRVAGINANGNLNFEFNLYQGGQLCEIFLESYGSGGYERVSNSVFVK